MAKKMSKAEQIRKLRATGLSIDAIASRVKLPRNRVQTEFWNEDNRERRRELARRWQREARQNPAYRALELEVMRERYRDDPVWRETVLARRKQWIERNREHYNAYQREYQKNLRARKKQEGARA